jgi:RNA polymerase sigma-70 factor (ECF subfamily)
MSIGSLSLDRTAAMPRSARTSRAGQAFVSRMSEVPNSSMNGTATHREAVNMVRPPAEVPDHELLARYVAGNEEAYVELYLRRQAEVYTFCLRLASGDRDFASDLFQETFIKVFRKAHTFREGTNVLGWLYTIVRTTYLNHKRKRQSILIDEKHEQIASTDRAMQPEYREEQSTIKERVERAISNLPVEIREPFILREFDGFSYSEIAEQLGLTLGGVRQRIYRAKLAMREELWDLVHDDSEDAATSRIFSSEIEETE